MKEYILIAAIIDLEFTQKLSEPIKLQDNTFITNNATHFRGYIKPEHYIGMGSLEGDFIYKGGPVVYKKCLCKDIEGSHVALVEFMRDVHAFFMSLWIVKDNNANIELAFAISKKDSHVHSNSLTYYNTQHNTDNTLITFTNDELEKVSELCQSHFIGMSAELEPSLTMSQKQIKRPQVAISFLQQARSSSDIGVKIANYCSYFEALISTNSAELTHQLSERAAFLLRDIPQERYEHFKKTKKAYGVRSKIVHGDVLSTSQLTSIEETSLHCDQVARELMDATLENADFLTALNDKDNSVLDEYLIKKVFGIN